MTSPVKPIVLLHGFLGSPRDWSPLVSSLPSHFDVMLPLLPGHTERIYQTEVAKNEIAELLPEPNLSRIANIISEKIKYEEFHLVGYSLGGRIALKMCEVMPSRIKSLCLISAAPGLRSEIDIEERKKHDLIWAQKIEDDFKIFLQDWYDQPLFKDLSDIERRHLIEIRSHNNAQAMKSIFLGASQATNPHSWRTIEELKMPALYITGEFDDKYKTIGREIVSTNPKFKFEVIAQAGHSPHITQPIKTGLTLKEFIESI